MKDIRDLEIHCPVCRSSMGTLNTHLGGSVHDGMFCVMHTVHNMYLHMVADQIRFYSDNHEKKALVPFFTDSTVGTNLTKLKLFCPFCKKPLEGCGNHWQTKDGLLGLFDCHGVTLRIESYDHNRMVEKH